MRTRRELRHLDGIGLRDVAPEDLPERDREPLDDLPHRPRDRPQGGVLARRPGLAHPPRLSNGIGSAPRGGAAKAGPSNSSTTTVPEKTTIPALRGLPQ